MILEKSTDVAYNILMSTTYSQKDLDEHLAQEHGQSTISTHIKEVVYGGIDGIITTFAVVAGFTGVASLDEGNVTIPIIAVLIFGLANLLADGFSMGIGEFLSARSEKKFYEKEYEKELREIDENQEMEIAESKMILNEQGFSEKQAEELVNIYKTNPVYWANFMMRYELEMQPPEESPVKNAIATFLSFIIFGFVPLVPYFTGLEPTKTFLLSASCAIAALFLLGILRAKITKEPLLRSIAEIVSLGILAGSVAFFVGYLLG